MSNKKQLDVVVLTGINSFCLLILLFNRAINNIITYIITGSIIIQIFLNVIYYKVYERYEIENKFIYYINFVINILTLVLYTYYIISISLLDIVFMVYIIYTFSSFYWLIIIVRDILRKKFYKLISLSINTECSICYEQITNNASKLECGHIYHRECIDKWVQVNSTCPYCRHSLSSII
jgi:hypothetical protein